MGGDMTAEHIALSLRRYGHDRYSKTVDWPPGAPIPRIGDTVSLNGEALYRIRDVQWWLDDAEHTAMGLPRLVVELRAE